MYAQIRKSKESKGRESGISVALKKSNGKQGLEFMGNQPQEIVSNESQYFTRNNKNTVVAKKQSYASNMPFNLTDDKAVLQFAPVDNIGGGDLSNDANLEKQTGGSCWLFVLDAILTEFGEGSLLNLAKHLYPETDDLLTRAKIDGVGKSRELALTMIIEKLDLLLNKLGNVHGDTVSKEKFSELSRRALGVASMHVLTDDFFAVTDPLDVVVAIEKVKAVKTDVMGLIATITDPTKSDLKDDEKLLGDQRYDFSGGGYLSIKRLKYLLNFTGGKLPMYMFLNTRFKARPEDDMNATDVDWTGRNIDEITNGGNHAVMLVGVNYGSLDVSNLTSYDSWGDGDTDGFISYKDPNYGDVKIKITWEQLQKMMMKQGNDAYFGVSSHD